MTSLYLELPSDIVLTANQRLHWRPKAHHTKSIRTRTRIAAQNAQLGPLPMCRVIVTLKFADRRRRDVHNWMPTAKAAIDGLVDAGVWPDDSGEYVIGPDLRVADETGARGLLRMDFEFQAVA